MTTFRIPLRCYKKFVDDTFIIIKEADLNDFFNHMNSIHPKIKFTILPFLDTMLKRNNDGSISVLVYRKPTHTDQYLNFVSNHPSNTKDAVISALFRRARDIVAIVKTSIKRIKE